MQGYISPFRRLSAGGAETVMVPEVMATIGSGKERYRKDGAVQIFFDRDRGGRDGEDCAIEVGEDQAAD